MLWSDLYRSAPPDPLHGRRRTGGPGSKDHGDRATVDLFAPGAPLPHRARLERSPVRAATAMVLAIVSSIGLATCTTGLVPAAAPTESSAVGSPTEASESAGSFVPGLRATESTSTERPD